MGILGWRGALAAAAAALSAVGCATAQETAREPVYVYGPGGPAPAMRDVAAAFEAQGGAPVVLDFGPPPRWLPDALVDADVIYSGSENMMTNFVRAFDGALPSDGVAPLYIRPSTILVRPGNPEAITGARDLAREGLSILVVDGAGQVGLWEDVAGRTGDLALVRGVRENIAVFAPNSGAARQAWLDNDELDAWLIWNHWQIANTEHADAVEVEPELRVWRPMSVGLTTRGAENADAVAFRAFLETDEAAAIFARWGWTGAAAQ